MERDQETVFGHHPGLFLLFFTEMWERFSYYGMRALLVLFLVSQAAAGGWEWERGSALQLYAWYTGLVYLTPILGGILADKVLGHRNAVFLGAFLMTLGHGSMALESAWAFYSGLFLLIAGNGFFKPNISTIVGQLYKNLPEKKDGAYTIFYMGINAGAFFGMLLCGYLGEKVSWSYGFGLAGIFMLLGMIMFQLGRPILGPEVAEEKLARLEEEVPKNVEIDRLIVIGVLSFFTIFFWVAFEQAGGSMTIFAKDYTQRVLTGSAATFFFWMNTLLTVVPLALVTFVLFRLFMVTFKKIPFSNISIAISFILVWGISLWMLNKEFNMTAYSVSFKTMVSPKPDAAPEEKEIVANIQSDIPYTKGQQFYVADIEGKKGQGKVRVLSDSEASAFDEKYMATVVEQLQNETEVPASWFQILNAFFIITFAPLFSRIWESKFNPSPAVKFGWGLVLLGLGFGALAYASSGIPQGATSASISMVWLFVAYLLHTWGELCVSPVGLSYVSKLAPLRFVGLMFGVWFLASALANYLAGFTGSYIDAVSEEYGLTIFFLIYTAIPIVAGITLWIISGWLRRMMHGVE